MRQRPDQGRSLDPATRSSAGLTSDSPKDRFLTVFGHRPVLAALADRALDVDKVLIADGEHGPAVSEIEQAARRRGLTPRRVPAHRIKLLSGNGKHDNGVLADVHAPRMRTLTSALASPTPPSRVLLLDGVRTPANVGMILRTATAAGLDGIVVPHRGTAGLDPLVVKASAGVAFRAPILRVSTAAEAAAALRSAGYAVLGLRADAESSLFAIDLPPEQPLAFVLGSETTGVSEEVARLITTWVAIPMPGQVESLNVASAAAVVCFDLVRRAEAQTRA
jgi:23S rRNA (guanosine2251-2'-O)-methyltransferase